jgi:hypothetical protein
MAGGRQSWGPRNPHGKVRGIRELVIAVMLLGSGTPLMKHRIVSVRHILRHITQGENMH